MLSRCPHCRNRLQLNEAQQEKVKQALAALPEGKTLSLACPICREPIHLARDGQPLSAEAGLEPAAARQSVKSPPLAPAPPDIGWLQSGEEVGDTEVVIRDAPLAMVLLTDAAQRRQVAEALEGQGYLTEFPASVAAAQERMRFVNFAAVVLHTGFEGGTLANSVFHQHLQKLPMAGRRLLLYVLVGPDFHTLYDLEALACSANLVVNEQDLGKLPLILKKAGHDYQILFGPYLEALKAHGKLS